MTRRPINREGLQILRHTRHSVPKSLRHFQFAHSAQAANSKYVCELNSSTPTKKSDDQPAVIGRN